MKKIDVVFAIICGISVAWIANDFLKFWPFYILLPALSILGLWACELIGKKFLFVHQFGKFGLAGAFADVVDIKSFQVAFWLISVFGISAPLLCKAFSFIVGTFVKYFSDKYWSFERHEKETMKKEIIQFFLIACGGMIINVSAFWFFTKFMGPQFGISPKLWTEASIILSAIVAAAWNFSGYKFIVFKK